MDMNKKYLSFKQIYMYLYLSMENSNRCPHRCVGIFIALFLLFAVLSIPVYCDDEDDLLAGINSFRQSSNAPALSKNDKADCVAEEIANQLENKPCASNTTTTQSQIISDYPNVVQKCNVDGNTTTEGVVLPVCVPQRVSTLVLTNYTQSRNSRYLNDTKFTGVGVGTEDDWTVLVLTTSTPGGSFANEGRALFGSSRSLKLSSLFCLIALTAIHI
ncbi:uncharacterized GPI-anchored protein At3g06035-like [Primulina eburnea]|uniref:uncharacterized GPI-anchored protein At3g06035-like n=1 Tax=Primulina eburnea TaxID=1245227 RepID=UPI003C6C846A